MKINPNDISIGLDGLESISMFHLAARLAKDGADSIQQMYPHPFLVVVFQPQDDSDIIEIHTKENRYPDQNDLKNRLISKQAIRIIKTERNAFDSQITLGRAKNNDIIIRRSRVSKLHLAFLPQKDASYYLVDMGSFNGTMVNGARVKPNEPVLLGSTDKIGVWPYLFEFAYLNDFLKLLKNIKK